MKELLKRLGREGRMISPSKTMYRMKFPENEVVFNANIITEEGKIWYGDIDLTLESDLLQNISNETKKFIYVLKEYDARFENENLTLQEYKEKAVAIFNPQ